MPHLITERCIGCTACVKVCPVEAITGVNKELHHINPAICIDCGACTYVCPEECIENPCRHYTGADSQAHRLA